MNSQYKLIKQSIDVSQNDINAGFTHTIISIGFIDTLDGESLITQGNYELGMKFIKKGWITAKLSKSDLRFFRKKYKKYLNLKGCTISTLLLSIFLLNQIGK